MASPAIVEDNGRPVSDGTVTPVGDVALLAE
jgi:hypothetical protein